MNKNKLACFIAGTLLSGSLMADNKMESYSYNSINSVKSVFQLDMLNPIDLSKDVEYYSDNNKVILRLLNTTKKVELSNQELDGVGTVNSETRNEHTVIDFKLNEGVSYNLINNKDKLMVVFEKSSLAEKDAIYKKNETYSPRDAIITDIDFERENNGGSQISIDFKNKIRYETIESPEKYRIVLYEAKLPAKLFRSIDVADFDTPIEKFTSRVEEGNTIVDVYYKKDVKTDNMITKVGNKIVLLINKKVETASEANKYKGHLIDLDFQETPLKATIQQLANKMNLNVLLSEKIEGVLTLKIDDVPYDEALNAILESKNLGSKKTGNITYIAPLSEIHEKEKYTLEKQNRIDELTPMKAFSWQVKYAKASDLVAILSNFSSEKGGVIFDERTNTIMVKDIPAKIDAMEEKIVELDVPVRQVVVESRIVLVKRSDGQGFGVNWNGSKTFQGGSDTTTISGGASDLINLALNNPTTNLAIGFISDTKNLDFAISALERKGSAEVLSRPKIITSDKKTATIETGQQYPFQQIGENGITGTQFEDITLSLEVTPTITPDDKVMMELSIQQESLAQLTQNGPAIDRSSIKTQVLANNGETIVLGGIYKTEKIMEESKVPLLGDIPFLGKLFRQETERTEHLELLIFITPKLYENEVVN